MKKRIIKEDGYTIVELLVMINISMITIVLFISLFLFIFKLSATLQNKITDKADVYEMYYILKRKLLETDYLILYSDDDKIIIETENNLIEFNQNQISIDKTILLENLDNYTLKLEGKKTYKIHNGSSEELKNGMKENIFVKTVTITVEKNKKKYNLMFTKYNSEINEFENI